MHLNFFDNATAVRGITISWTIAVASHWVPVCL